MEKTKKPKKYPFSWASPSLEVRDTGRCGKGSFAIKKIKKDEIIAIHGGHLLTVAEEENLPEDIRDYGVQISERFIMTITSHAEKENDGFYNHNCNPNAGYKGQIFLVAMRDIKKGEEITFDYGMVLYKPRDVKPYQLECFCGSKNCRKIIKDDDWKIPELQEKYDGYFQYFLQEKINKLRSKNK